MWADPISFGGPSGCFFVRYSGMVRKHQTRNLEIPGSMLRIAPE
jgi:hypothetical protein